MPSFGGSWSGPRRLDLIKSRGGASDLVLCGRGRDVVLVDKRDIVRGCEKIRKPKKK